MSCPLFQDFTRGCVGVFYDSLRISNFEFCTSEKWEECPFYKLIKKVETICEFSDKCPIYFHIAKKDINGFIKMTKEYCFSNDFTKCARYKFRKVGKMPPKELYPDGRMIELID